MLSWLIEHSGLSGGIVGIFAHLGTEVIGFIRDKAKFANIENLAEIKSQTQVQISSYHKADMIHLIVISVLLLCTIVSYALEGPDYKLSQVFTSWTGIGIFWFFGRIATRGRISKA